VKRLFAQVGVIDPQTGSVKLLGETWVDEELEWTARRLTCRVAG
jgi:hypothetical protein